MPLAPQAMLDITTTALKPLLAGFKTSKPEGEEQSRQKSE
jgi:hypothetical protein